MTPLTAVAALTSGGSAPGATIGRGPVRLDAHGVPTGQRTRAYEGNG